MQILVPMNIPTSFCNLLQFVANIYILNQNYVRNDEKTLNFEVILILIFMFELFLVYISQRIIVSLD